MIERASVEVTGLVQGVGFRPFVYSLATALDLRGFVQNRGAHVFVDVEGESSALHAFVDRLRIESPPNAAIDRVRCHPLAPAHHDRFVIAGSEAGSDSAVRVPPDVATCDECRQEMSDPANRRYRHPFITCTSCGPRFSIVTKMPYDRADTAMGVFAMCELCRAEYANPLDRRFHAQAIACLHCGPVLIARDRHAIRARGEAALAVGIRTLREGGIVALKGLGGFHLACDATRDDAVAELRRRKGRDAKPLAVMVPDAAGRLLASRVGAATLAALTSRERPIVLVPRRAMRNGQGLRIAPNVAEGSPALGVLLPYTPLHHLLLEDFGGPLVMTSGNRHDEPMVCGDEDAVQQLGEIADVFLTHDRRIETRCDDTVVRVDGTSVSPVRRARGYAPSPLRLAESVGEKVLAVGGHLKNTFCIVASGHAYVSQHIGNLDTLACCQALGSAVSQMSALVNVRPTLVAHDRHPDYMSTRFAMAFPADRQVAVQHHHAHVLSCVAEHQFTEPVIGVAFDGAGLGDDGATWGGEFLVVEGVSCRRAAHLAYVPLPGGDVAAREPWRMAVAHLAAAHGPGLGPLAGVLAERVTASRLDFVGQMIGRGVCSPRTSSIGRLFDAVAAIIGLRDVTAFEGQAAMELEAIAAATTTRDYRFAVDTRPDVWTIDAAPVVRQIVMDILGGQSPAELSAAFHAAVGTMIADVAARLARRTGIRHVALTGGVFQNALLSQHTVRGLDAVGLDVLQHRQVPCNDGGLSLGQALLALRMVRADAVASESITCV
jgi:hydrogenase maturation protein HypF